jgi:hypothetical protein
MKPVDLVVGTTYFSISYGDPDLLAPIVESLVYIGRDLQGDGQLHFQDVASFRRGDTWQRPGPASKFVRTSTADMCQILDFDELLNAVLDCAARRRAPSVPPGV